MPSYVVTGASRGIGWGFITYLSQDPSNIVIGLVRNAPPTIDRVKAEFPDRKNIHILQADLNDNPAIKAAAASTARVTGGSLDYLIGNAAYLSLYDQFEGPKELLQRSSHEEFTKEFHAFMGTNVLAQIFLYDAFLPLILKGGAKIVLSISSGMGDLAFNRDFDLDHAIFYSSSKAALNMVNAKFGAQYKKDGVLFLSMCPGVVNTSSPDGCMWYRSLRSVTTGQLTNEPVSPKELAKLQEIGAKFQAYSPTFQRPYEPVESVEKMLGTVSQLSIENGDQGRYLSHLGGTKWLP